MPPGIGAGLGRRKRAELLELLRPCFRAGGAVAAGGQVRGRADEPDSPAQWLAAAAMRVVRRFAVAGLDQAARISGRRSLAVGAIDETVQVKQGDRTAAVKRQYLGCAGKVANGSPPSTWPMLARAPGTH
jgi:hypothetical protein